MPERIIVLRCTMCGKRLGDFTPPIGAAEIRCTKCKTTMYLSITPIPSGLVTTESWYVRKWFTNATG